MSKLFFAVMVAVLAVLLGACGGGGDELGAGGEGGEAPAVEVQVQDVPCGSGFAATALYPGWASSEIAARVTAIGVYEPAVEGAAGRAIDYDVGEGWARAGCLADTGKAFARVRFVAR